MPRTKKIDYLFFFVVIALCAVGLVMVFSASPAMGMKHGDAFYYIKRHLFHLAIGFLAFYYALRLDLEKIRVVSEVLLLITFLLLILVFIPGIGRKVLGASRWIDLGLLSFQPSELMKFSFTLFLAKWFTIKREEKSYFVKFPPPFFLFVLISGAILMQPDMGTVVVLGASTIVMFFIAGINYLHLFLLLLAGSLGSLALVVAVPYRFRRLTAFLNPWQDPQGAGFQIIQSLLAVGSGGLLGMGLGASRQKFFYLPQQFTDFIFAILCEELGFLGGVTVIILFSVFAARGFRIALRTEDRFKSFLAAGITSWLTLQALTNILVVIGLVPTTGIPLPFISYGGTATIINLFASGIVLNISRR